MDSSVNAHGLSRNISDPIALKIRQKSGFGCVFCGLWIYEYEHILPEFKDATSHDPDKICLLCSNHHQKVTQKRIGKQQVIDQYKHPLALQKGYANDFLELNRKFGIVLGRIFIPEPKDDILLVDGVSLISVKQPTETEPLKLNAKFFDNQKNLIMEIVDNEQRGYTKNWDIKQEGTRTTIRRKKGDIVLQINILSPNVLQIGKINMKYGDSEIISESSSGKIFLKNKGVLIDFPTAQIITQQIKMNDLSISFDKGLVLSVQDEMSLKEMDYQLYMETGQVQSK